jgi:hypothetical protein
MKTDHEKNHMDFFTFNDGSYEELKIISFSIRLKDKATWPSSTALNLSL